MTATIPKLRSRCRGPGRPAGRGETLNPMSRRFLANLRGSRLLSHTMVNRNLLRQFDVPAEDIQQNDLDFDQAIAEWIRGEEQEYEANKIVTGKVLEIRGDDVVIDIGYKSE